MFRHIALVFFLFSVRKASCWKAPVLNGPGPAGCDLRVTPVSRASAFDHMKSSQVKQIRRNAPEHVCRELNVARELLRDPGRKDDHVAFLSPASSDQILFTIVYRVREKRIPSVYTLEAIVREPGYDVRSSDVHRIVQQLVWNNMGFLQSYPLKVWARGKYDKELFLEKMITMD